MMRAEHRTLLTVLLRAAMLVFCSLSLGACAAVVAEMYQEPQQVMIKPELEIEPTPIGRERVLALDVVDRRSKNILGYRGGVDPTTAPIHPKSSVVNAVREALAQALGRYDFVVDSSAAANRILLRVEIGRLDYVANHELWPTSITTTGTVKVFCENGREYYSNRIAAEYTKGVRWPPGEKAIGNSINKALSRMLDRLLRDPGLLEILSHEDETWDWTHLLGRERETPKYAARSAALVPFE